MTGEEKNIVSKEEEAWKSPTVEDGEPPKDV